MPKGVYERTEENRKKIGEARRRYYDEHGRVVEIDQRVNPRDYQREYQRQWRAKHKHYYRDRRRMKKKIIAGDDMIKLQKIQSAWNIFISKSIEFEYRTSAYNEGELKKLADDVTNEITNYLAEMKKENEVKDEDKV